MMVRSPSQLLAAAVVSSIIAARSCAAGLGTSLDDAAFAFSASSAPGRVRGWTTFAPRAKRAGSGDIWRPLSRGTSCDKTGALRPRRALAAAAARSEVEGKGEGENVQPSTTPRARLVWLTGHGDLRLHDHGGFSAAVSAVTEEERIVPVFILDPNVHLRSRPESFVRRLHACLSSLEEDVAALSSSSSTSRLSPLIVRTGSFAQVLPTLVRETNAAALHVIGDDVVTRMRTAQRDAVSAVIQSMPDVEVVRWTNCLRPEAPWSKLRGEQGKLPSFFPDYCKVADPMPTVRPKEVDWDALLTESASGAESDADDKVASTSDNASFEIPSEGVPTIDQLLALASHATPAAVTDVLSSRPEYCITTEPYETTVTDNWCTERGARAGLEEYCSIGRDAFANKYFQSDNIGKLDCEKSKSMYAQAAARILRDIDRPSEVLALRETATRAFSSALKLGALSPKDVVDAAKNRHVSTGSSSPFSWGSGSAGSNLVPSDDPLWGRSSEGSLHDVVEWREWFLLLAERSLALQEQGMPATSGGEKIGDAGADKIGDPREDGEVNYWRWKGQHLVRYLTWPAGEGYDKQEEEERAPAILLVHGFAASAEQWSRLVHSIRAQTISENGGNDVTPPIYAVDLLGFGHSEKPGLSYTQYLWESQLVDFAMEVMEATPMVMAGNSIGGGISAGAAASLGNEIVRGLVLCNTAGVLEDPDSYSGYEAGEGIKTWTEAALEGNRGDDPYAPVPLFGNKALDAFGTGIVKLIYPQIEDRLSIIYGNRMENADPAVVYAIQQGAASPGSANVIGSGQKLAPNRPLNEVLMGNGEEGNEGFPVLVVMGLDDRVSSPQVAKTRAELFSRLSPGKVVVEEIEDAGHCPHDDAPERVAATMLKWLPSCGRSSSAT